ncbi:MAG: hypothetical protein ACP5NQ_03335 [Vulcanisaeta sp.]
MRKGLLIAGAVLIVLAIVIFFIGVYLSSGVTSNLASIVAGIRNEAVMKPGSSISIGNASSGVAIVVIYNDTLRKPLNIVTTTNTGLIMNNIPVDEQYMVVYSPPTGSGALYLVNNYSEGLTIYYTYGTINIASLMPLAVSTFLGLGAGIVGVVLLILGVVLRGR